MVGEAVAGCGNTWFIHTTSLRSYRMALMPQTLRMLKKPSSKAAVSEEAKRRLRYVELLSDARTTLAEFFSILDREREEERTLLLWNRIPDDDSGY
jgi:hypothetical protein